VRNVRFALPTDQLDEVVRFYREGLGPTYWTENGAVPVEDPDRWRVVLIRSR
jgi:YycE-like protein